MHAMPPYTFLPFYLIMHFMLYFVIFDIFIISNNLLDYLFEHVSILTSHISVCV